MKRFLRLFNKENSVREASVILIITLAISNLMGLFRDILLAKNIDSYHRDIYYAAFRIPDFIFNLIILGAIISAFVPVFSEFLARDKKDDGFKTANILINIALLFMVCLGIILWFAMPALMPLIVNKFDPYRMSQAILYSRILLLLPIFFSVSYIIGGMLNCFKQFFIYSLSPLFYNLAIIVGAAFLAPRYGAIGVVYCVAIGAFLHFIILIPSIKRSGFHYKPIISFTDENVRRIIRLMVPRSISMGANQIMLAVFTTLASGLAVGSISAFNLANNMQSVPVSVLGTSFATAIFPTLSMKIIQKKKDEFVFYLNRSLRAIAYFLIPSTVIFILLRAQIVRLFYGHGKFDWDDTKMTAIALAFFAISILAQGILPILARAFYAMKNTKTPMYCAIIAVVASIAVAYPLAQNYSVAGLALAFSVGSYVNVFMLLYYLHKIYPGIIGKSLYKSLGITSLISLAMGLAVWSSMHIAANYVDMTRFSGVLLQTIIALIAGGTIFFGLSYFFDQEEMRWAISRKINGRKPKLEEQLSVAE